MIFSRKIKKEEVKETAKTDKNDSKKTETPPNKTAYFGLVPHVTEKATFLGQKNVYVFKTEPKFNKIMIRQTVKKQYNVEPMKVRIINIPGKTVFIRRRRAQKPGYKKAIIYLKKGDKITI